MNDDGGWIKLSRKILQSKHYLGEKFTRVMCWIDLLLIAEWRGQRSFYHRGIQITVKRGQIAMSLDDLHKRWNLSINTVRKRLSEMAKDGRIEVTTDNVITRITIQNYEKYQAGEDKVQPAADKPIPDAAESQSKQIAELPLVIEPEIEEKQSQQETKESEPALPLDAPKSKTKREQVDCDFIVRLYHDRCPSLPKVIKLSDKRKTKVLIKFEEMEFNYETLQEVFDKAQASSFLRGDNDRGWRADFDWLFANGKQSSNWVKILEGKYDDHKSPIIRNDNGTTPNTAPPQYGGCKNGTPLTASERQRMSVYATLAKITSEQEGENIPPRFSH